MMVGLEAGQCIDELLKIKNLIYLLGNHDDWTLQWALTGENLTHGYHRADW